MAEQEVKRRRRMSGQTTQSSILTRLPPELVWSVLAKNVSVKDALTFCAAHPQLASFCRDDQLWAEWFRRDFPRASQREGETSREAYNRTVFLKRAVAKESNRWRADQSEDWNLKQIFFKQVIHDPDILAAVPSLRTSSTADIAEFVRRHYNGSAVAPALTSAQMQVALDSGVQAMIIGGDRFVPIAFFFLTPSHEVIVPWGGALRSAARFKDTDAQAVAKLGVAIPLLG